MNCYAVMKRFLTYMSLGIIFLLLYIGCAKDNIVLVDPQEEDDADDYISNTTFARTVNVVYSANGNATVSEVSSDFSVSVSGNDVTIEYTGDEYVMYNLSGSTTDGFFKLYSGKRQGITLNDASITNPNGAAVNVQGPKSSPSKGKRTFVVVVGTNVLSDGTSYTDTPNGEDEKAVLFGEGQLVFSGTGSLTINASGKAGIVSDDYVRFMSSPVVKVVSSAGHGVRGKDFVMVSDGNLDIEVSANRKKGICSDGYVVVGGGSIVIKVTGSAAYDDEDREYAGTAGIKADLYFKMNAGSLAITNSGQGGKGISADGAGYFNGGTVTVTTTGSNYTSGSVSAKGIKVDGDLKFTGGNVLVNCSADEAIESKGCITISGGTVYAHSAADDAINSSSDFTISGGYVCGYATSNDGLDANGNFYISGGTVYAIGSGSPEVAVDANTEGGYKLYVTGGTIVAIGGLERGSSLSQNCYSASSWQKNTWYSLNFGSETIAYKTPASGGTAMVVSASSSPTLQSGVTVSGGTSYFDGMMVVDCSVSGGTSVSLSSYSGESGDGSGGNPGGGSGGPGGGNPPGGAPGF